MIVDTSALIAVIVRESERDRILAALSAGEPAAIGAPTMFETELVACARMGPDGRQKVREVVDALGLRELPFEGRHRRAATAAFLRFGKGRHPARLNLADCMTYATAKIAREPLLCVGDDFAKTDLELVLPPG